MHAPAATQSEKPEPNPPRRRALFLEWLTIAWNGFEVVVTVGLGLAAHSLALIAFGMDSLVEIFASLVVVWHLGGDGTAAAASPRRRRALRLVALAFVLLAGYLVASATHALLTHQQPDSSPVGMAYLAVTAVVMFTLARAKQRLGQQTGDGPLQAEASMTFLDGWLALSILAALAANAVLGWWWADPAAAGLIAVAALGEARGNWKEAAEC